MGRQGADSMGAMPACHLSGLRPASSQQWQGEWGLGWASRLVCCTSVRGSGIVKGQEDRWTHQQPGS